MNIRIRLHGVFRDRLPDFNRGETELVFPDGTSLKQVLTSLDIERHFHVALNGEVTADYNHPLSDGDTVEVFRPSAGG